MALTNTMEMPVDYEKDYMGTVRACFKNIIKPEMYERFLLEGPEFFVLDQSSESMRKPGNNNFFISLLNNIS